ncbi:anhydro-N-acetylmuramic acid kinase [Fontimonas thermophila]|uniref:Anhydro-N-acetylmuramic acid kinase n=1 Tax=Fontimonas thermophila TaxID=1076937 RepID=A0A1I2JAN4_9GAMM|nr:anhydro-N-acetylmuramic acid kinase [Fontimonas thermophila]SFF51584.1 anhydro-N-acetylmuramic acid kinase [Fontimonas thermophila]
MHTWCIGLMSGTSADAVDAALCAFDDQRFRGVHATASLPYPADLRARLLALQRGDCVLALGELCAIDNAVAICFAQAAQTLLAHTGLHASAIAAIGSHGQTVFHDPEHTGSSLQLGNPALIAARTSITTVADFRRADIARGGHGAPLVPAFHHALFADAGEPRCVVNIGGIANITVLPGEDQAAVRGFDTGPGNALMDEWAELHLNEPYDRDGHWAASGSVQPALLDVLLNDSYFARPPPKSTGRGQFNLAWVRHRYPRLDQLARADVQRTFCELTALTIAHAILDHAPATRRVLICGGGARNTFLRTRLGEVLGDSIALDDTADHGVDALWVEAAAFAWLALCTLHGRPGNLPSVTGARSPAILGGIYRG